jgi:acetoin utilization deacetylase AcuC-like enzyme
MIPGHPECPARVASIEDRLISTGLFNYLKHCEAPKATGEQLAHVHDTLHIRELLAAAPTQGLVPIDPDTFMNPHSMEAALRAAGALVMATDMVLSGEVKTAFCNVRPPGHHAERAQSMGFCFFNNVAVGAAHALEIHGLERVAIVDFDVHHGNGTEDIFADDYRVMVCSSYQHPFYPFSGRPTVEGHLINIPLKAGTDGKSFRAAVESKWLPALGEFKPQLIFVSAGFDAHYEDDMAGLALTDGDYEWITRAIMSLAARYAQGRVVSTLEGGYALDALARSAAIHLRVLMELS